MWKPGVINQKQLDDLFLLYKMSLTLYKWIIRLHYTASLLDGSKIESGFKKQTKTNSLSVAYCLKKGM